MPNNTEPVEGLKAKLRVCLSIWDEVAAINEFDQALIGEFVVRRKCMRDIQEILDSEDSEDASKS
jgi:hypothetical protein